MNTVYDKKNALMTRGLAILSMLILHLFCRTGEEVYGTPLLWLNETTPLVYWFGFFAEICVALYSLCAGYAQQIMVEQNRSSWKSNLQRIFKLMVNYWIILLLFCLCGLIFDPGGAMPGSLFDFLKSIVLLHSYNGAWWYLHTYVILLLIPPKIIMAPANRISVRLGLLGCFGLLVFWYLLGKIGVLVPTIGNSEGLNYLWSEFKNLCKVLPCFWGGVFLCRCKPVERIGSWANEHIPSRFEKMLLAIVFAAIFIIFNVLHKSVLVSLVTVATFLIFNLWKKTEVTQKVFLYLGRHSTNIWLTHMFFYLYIFVGLVQKVKYPIFMLVFMLILCIATSYIEMGIEKALYKLMEQVRILRNRIRLE